jgi:hypothetical protein
MVSKRKTSKNKGVNREKVKRNNKTKKIFLYHPDNPDKSFDVYIDKNPKDTIPIKYKTLQDVKDTINKLEYLYKTKKYTHKRIWQVAMIMKVRLSVLVRNSSKTSGVRGSRPQKLQQYRLAEKYFNFLKLRTKLNPDERFKSTFKF